MIRVCRVGVCVAVATVAFAGESAGQATSGTIRGSVRDPQGSPVPSAVVEVMTRGTALTRRATSDADGSFVVPDVPPATVDITVTAPGFGEAHRTGVVIEIGQTASLVVELAVQRVRETVVVGGAVGVVSIDTSRSVVDAVIPAQLIESLPLNGRNFLELALLVPGNAPAPNFDPDQVEHRHDLFRRSARAGRQHHGGRRGQQRRCGGRAAAERHAGGGAGVPDRDQPLHGGVGAFGIISDQRRDQVGQRRAARLDIALPAR